ncbi:MAG: 3-hydroxyacyl-ACP dehydratase [Candidatus Adiutrix sp.]|jgi:predicted hotdog family 3-hydroxylacyl-ACP dehydratase|nr:3-hydroxyacyl-ACP dehydratase [Candidatus Adiutrix sp.]
MGHARPEKVQGLIPHRPPMLVLDELLSVTGEAAESRTVFDEGCLFLSADGQVEEAVLFEMMAQTFAALACCQRGAETAGSAGFLVGLKRVALRGRARLGFPVTVKVRIFSQVEDFSVVDGEAFQDGELLAAGQLTIYVPREGRA